MAAGADDWEPGDVIAGLLAHQGGWDEALFVAVPMLLFVGLLWIAKRRADAEATEEQVEPGPDDR